jgi:hypothetical protein
MLRGRLLLVDGSILEFMEYLQGDAVLNKSSEFLM